MGELCTDCGKSPQVLWCPIWSTHLCVFCRANRTAQELRLSQKKWFAESQ